jgi:glycosyltransferase involved in cell wall biosynthesis
VRIVFHAWRDLDHPDAGGQERLVHSLIVGLDQRGHEVALCTGTPAGRREYPVVAAGGRFTQYLRMPFSHRRSLRDPDLVVDVISGMTYFSPLWQRRPTLLLHTHVHLDQWSLMFPAPIAAVGRLIEGRLVPRVYRRSLTVAISESSAHDLVGLGTDRNSIRILPVPAETPTVVGERSAEPLFVNVGRLVPYKRIDTLLRVWEDVRPVTGGRLVIVGDGPQRAALEALAGPGVEFVGYISDEERARLQHSAWLQVHTAAHEGWGIVITEAAGHGTPTLAYRVPGVRDAVIDGETGVLVDDDDQLTAAWIDLAQSPRRRDELGEGARRHAATHTVDAAVDAFEAFALEAIERAR